MGWFSYLWAQAHLKLRDRTLLGTLLQRTNCIWLYLHHWSVSYIAVFSAWQLNFNHLYSCTVEFGHIVGSEAFNIFFLITIIRITNYIKGNDPPTDSITLFNQVVWFWLRSVSQQRPENQKHSENHTAECDTDRTDKKALDKYQIIIYYFQ